MGESRTPNEVSGADQYDPLHKRRRFSWKVFFVAAVIIVGYFFLRNDVSDIGFGIAMALCAVVAIAVAAPSAFSESWASDTKADLAVSREEAVAELLEGRPKKSDDDAV